MRIIKGNWVESPGFAFKSCIKMGLHIKEKYHFCEKKLSFTFLLIFWKIYMAIDLFRIGKATLKHFLRVFKLTFMFCR